MGSKDGWGGGPSWRVCRWSAGVQSNLQTATCNWPGYLPGEVLIGPSPNATAAETS